VRVCGGGSVELVLKKWLARERYVCVCFRFVERERERIYNEWGLMRCESPVTVRICRR